MLYEKTPEDLDRMQCGYIWGQIFGNQLLLSLLTIDEMMGSERGVPVASVTAGTLAGQPLASAYVAVSCGQRSS
jgi:hypothetical protein